MVDRREKMLLIVFHTQSGHTEQLAVAVEQGAKLVKEVVVRCDKACNITATDLESSDLLVICSPEYFGYMAGAIKDLFDRTYEEIRERVGGKPYAVIICAGNDGTGALESIERIIKGYGFRMVQEPIISRGEVEESMLRRCRELGQTLAAGMELGIY